MECKTTGGIGKSYQAVVFQKLVIEFTNSGQIKTPGNRQSRSIGLIKRDHHHSIGYRLSCSHFQDTTTQINSLVDSFSLFGHRKRVGKLQIYRNCFTCDHGR